MGDKIWLVQFEALDSEKRPVPGKFEIGPKSEHPFGGAERKKPELGEAGKEKVVTVEYLHLTGLCKGETGLVNTFFDKLRAQADYFVVDEKAYQAESASYLQFSSSTANKIARQFNILLPLKDKIEIKLPAVETDK